MSNNSNSTDQITTPTTLYGYVPTLWICLTFVILFSITTVVHIFEAFLFTPRRYWLLPTTAMCGVGEIIGWSGRLWSNRNPVNQNAYTIQITTTIISPVFLTAALYTILGLIIEIVGTQYSRLRPKTYLKLFVTADVLSLLIQAAGGGIASGATTDAGANNGAHIMLVGIFVQMATMLCYTLLAAEFLLRVSYQNPLRRDVQASPPGTPDDKSRTGGAYLSPRIRLMVLGLALATVFVFIRTIYRTIELLGGWNGHIIRTQVFFDVLDATPIFLALFTLNFLSPAFLLLEKENPGPFK